MGQSRNLLRDLPSVDRLLAHGNTRALLARFNRAYVVHHCRQILDELRQAIADNRSVGVDALEEDSVVTRLEFHTALSRT